GPARILGLRDGIRNSKGFEGANGSVERGTPGFIPNTAGGRDAPAADVLIELDAVLRHYGLTHGDLPRPVCRAIKARKAFTLVEGVSPKDDASVFRGKIDADDLIRRTLRNDQATLA